MRRSLLLGACSGALALLAVVPAWGQTFTYSNNFNNWAAMERLGGMTYPGGAIPTGWRVGINNTVDYGELELNPQVLYSDGIQNYGGLGCWGSPGGCGGAGWGSARTDGLGQIDYTVPWSGTPGNTDASGQFVLSHPNYENFGRAAFAWYTGADHLNGGAAPHAGSYPMDLRSNYIKAEFDLSIRTGSSSWCGYYDSPANLQNVAADALLFAVQPVPNVAGIVNSGGWMGAGSVPGFNIEFDIYPNGATDPGAGLDNHNHVGLNVTTSLYSNPSADRLSYKTNLDAPYAASIVPMQQVGDNNQPIHVTVFYNDPAHGGLGVVQVYMYVDPATKAAGDPAVPAGQTPFEFGMTAGVPNNGGLGDLVLSTCIGAWTSEQAVFGFLGSTGGCNAILAVDNVAVTADAATGTACEPELNVVTITKDNDASEPSGNGQFTITRTGPTTSDLVVNFTVGGTASNNVDYAGLPGYALTTPNAGAVTIPAGSSSVVIPVNVIDDTRLEGTETIYVALVAAGTYFVGPANTATMTLTDDETSYYSTPTFVYSEDFNNWPNMLTNAAGIRMALGWLPWSSGYWDPIQGQPGIYGEEWGGANWGLLDPANPNGDPWHSRWGAQGVLDYKVPWSGTPGDIYHTGRYNLIHPGRDCNYQNCDTWYTGEDYIPVGCAPRHSGAYPMDLVSNSLRAEFDVSLRTGGGMTAVEGISGGVIFAVYPVDTTDNIVQGGVDGAWLGWGPGQNGAPGFAVEFDVLQDGGDPDGNHMGIDVGLLWSSSTVASVVTQSTIPTMVAVGDNNQPLHATVYYNDETHGGKGVIQVYLKVKAADKDAADPAFPTGQTPYTFGEAAGDPADGVKVLELCVGDWPAGKKAVFGFTSALVHYPKTTISQVDNVHVETAAATGTACTPTLLPVYTCDPAGHPVTLSAAPVAGKTLANLSQPGWDVRTYPMFGEWTTPVISFLKQSIGTCEMYGIRAGDLTGEADLNYMDADGGATNVPNPRQFPGLNSAYWNNYFGLAATGWIYFPQAGTYSLCANCDDAVELRIGNQTVLDTGGDGGVAGAGIDGGYIICMTVDQAGVYPIQVLYIERNGWSTLSLYRRVDSTPLLPGYYLPIGSNDWGRADQPLVFGLMDTTTAAPLNLDGQSPWGMAVVELATSERIGDATVVAGNQAFRTKAAQPTFYWWGGNGICADCNGYENGVSTGLRWADTLTGTPSESQVIAFGNSVYCNDGGCWWDNSFNLHNAGWWDQQFPGLPGHSFSAPYDTPDQFVFRAEGYAVFDHAGYYIIGVQSDDNAQLAIGRQMIQTQWCCAEPGRVVALHVTEPGTYPIRIDMREGGGGEKLRVYECAPGHAWCALNGPDSTIRVYTSLASGTDYVWPTHGVTIPATHKVAEVGQGGTLGWTGKFATFTNGIDPAFNGMVGVATAMVQNNMYVPSLDVAGSGYPNGILTSFTSQSTGTVETLDMRDPSVATENCGDWGQNQSRFAVNNAWGTVFGAPAAPDNNDQFGAVFSGYIEFPAAGDYMFNMIISPAGYLRIGGEYITGWFSCDGGATDNDAMTVHIEAPGIYDVRAEYLRLNWNGSPSCGPQIEPVLIRADGTGAALNDAASDVKVYQDLAPSVTKLTEAYRDPFIIPASAKAGSFTQGGEPGARIQIMRPTYVFDQWGDSQNGFGPGRANIYSIIETSAMMDSAIDPTAHPIDALNYNAAVMYDGVVPQVDFTNGLGSPAYPGTPFPATASEWFGARVTGYLALKAGGHLLDLNTDDGSKLWVGGKLVSYGGSGSGMYDKAGYVYIAEDGVYPFQVDYLGGGGGNALHLREGIVTVNPSTGAISITWELLNTGAASKVYATLCPAPWADADGDRDVDQADFGTFQACFTGPTPVAPLGVDCKCFDRTSSGAPGVPDSAIDAADYNAFLGCISGPTVQITDCP